MDNVIYLEADEEITSVVEKMKRTKSPVIGIVAPRNAVLLQSVVNLKLLKRQSITLKKDISLVTSDRIGQNLALRTGLTVYANVHDTEPLEPLKDSKPDHLIDEDIKANSPGPNAGFKVHRYDEIVDANDQTVEEAEAEEAIAPATNFSSRSLNKPIIKDEPDLGSQEDVESTDDSEDEGENDKNSSKEEMSEDQSKSESKSEPKEESSKESVKNTKTHPTIEAKNYSPLKVTKSKVNKLKIGLVAVIFLAIIAAVGYGAINSIAQGSLEVSVVSEPVKEDLTFEVSKDRTTNDNIKNIIPGRLIESEQQVVQKIKSTGTRDIGEKATGKITVTNEAGVGQSFEANTALKSSGGSIFRSNKAFTVPAATPSTSWEGGKWVTTSKPGSVTIDVTASEAGEKYNINATAYTVTGFVYISGSGTAMTGGATKEVTIVIKSDIDKATQSITADLTDKLLADLKKKSGNAIYLDKAIKTEVVSSSSDAEIDSQVDDFNMTIKLKSSVLVFDKSKLDELVRENLKSKIPANKTLLAANTEDLKIEVVSSDPQAGIMKLSSSAQGKIVPNLSKDKIQSQIAGQTPEQIKSYFNGKEDINSVKITLEPSWWLKKMPTSTSKIKVDIKTQDQ